MDFSEICDAQIDVSRYGFTRKVPAWKIARIRLFCTTVGFRQPIVPANGFNFNLRFVNDLYPEDVIVKLVRRSGRYELLIQNRAFKSVFFHEMFLRLLIVTRNYGHGIRRIFDQQFGETQDGAIYLNLGDANSTYDPPIVAELNLYAFARRNEEITVGLIPDSFVLLDIESEPSPLIKVDRTKALQ